MENELWNLSVEGTDIVGYTRCFKELALLCLGMVTSSNPTVSQEEIRMAHDLLDQVVRAKAAKDVDNKRKQEVDQGGNSYQQQNKRREVVRLYTARSDKKWKYCRRLENLNKAGEACQVPNILT
nr:hypothetical protein [Tanacetum cinerariifolium]